MSDLPTPQSFEQIQKDLLSTYAAKLGINDFNVGSAVTGFFETVALATARSSGDFFQILRDFSVDRAQGDALKRLAADNNVIPQTAKVASTLVTITDTSFTKVATKVYAGANPPNIGSQTLNISSSTGFPSSGAIYIGRGTASVEGPIAYSDITQSGSFYVLSLDTPTTKFHNVGEAVTLSQGGIRAIPVNTTVQVPASGSSAAIQYVVTAAAVILDGETTVSNVQVSAKLPGASTGNAPIGAIKSFATLPFSGATVTNPLPVTNGQDSDTDDQLRVRIKTALASKGLGTETAIEAAVNGATSSDETSTIVSTSIQSATYGSILYIDNGSGYEALSKGVGIETIVDSAIGGEQYFQLATGGRQAPVAKAFLQSTIQAPFDIIGGDTLSIEVGGVTYQHVFATSDFRSPGGATAYEITASVNANTAIGFQATTAGGGTYVVFRAINEGSDSLLIRTPTTSGRNAATQLGLTASQIDTLRLYKNKIPLSKDGSTATVFTTAQTLWSSTIATGDTLVLLIDGTQAITYTITNADFVATGLYPTVSNTNSLTSWVQVLNNKLTGVTAAVVGTQIALSSNLGTANRAKITIDPSSTLVSKGMFSASVGLSASGKTSDYTLSRNSAQFKLAVPLSAGDQLTAGSSATEARISSTAIPSGSLTLAQPGFVWIIADESAQIIPTSIASETVLSVSKPSTNIVRYSTTVTGAFNNVQVGDYLIVWCPELAGSAHLEGRVYAKTGITIDLLVTATEYAAVSAQNVTYSDGLVVVRTNGAPQKFTVAAGTATLDTIALALNAQTKEIKFSVEAEEFLIAQTMTKDSTGNLFVATSDTYGKLLGLTAGSTDYSKDSLIGYYNSGAKQAEFPLFIHSQVSSEASADPETSYVQSFGSAVDLSARDPNELIAILQPYGSIEDAQDNGENVQETAIVGQTVSIAPQPFIRRLRTVDRFYVASPLDFGSSDTLTAVLDGDTASKSFEIPMYRTAKTNTTLASNQYNFNAYDTDAGSAAAFFSSFGTNFDFSNFKVLMQAKKVLKPSAPKTAILYRAAKFGRSGEKINVAYIYPSSANSPLGSTVVVTDTVAVRINLASGAPVSSSIDSTTEWNVSVTPNTPTGVDQVTFTWNGTGTNPALSLSGGEFVNITSQSELNKANTGVYRVSTRSGFAPSSTAFTVTMPTGKAVAESNKATQVNGAITFFSATPTTAAQVAAYVNTTLSNYLSATLVMDTTTDGSGAIVLSTYEDSGFTSQSVSLLDGINWLASSSISGSPQFVFKKPLALPTDVGYQFNNGEVLKFSPTTMEQVQSFASILAVSGFTSIGTIDLVDRGSRVELATETVGSQGSIQIIGGLANSYSVPVLGSGARVDNKYMAISANRISSFGVHSDQWFRLQSSVKQSKQALFSSNTDISVQSSTPSTGSSLITMSGRSLTQRNFGQPRNHVRVQGNTFRVEKQGALVCVSWNGVGTSPSFAKATVNLNDSAGGTYNIKPIANSSDAQYLILSGNTNFSELSIGDLVTFNGSANAGNNGTFLISGISSDGQTLQVLNPNAVAEYSSGTFTFSANSTAGDTFTVGTHSFVAGTNFAVGPNVATTIANLAAIVGTLADISTSVSGNVLTITAQYAAANVALTYSGTSVVTVSNATLVGKTFSSGAFSAKTQVSEGDSVIFGSPFAALNQGTFRVIRRFNDSIWIENVNAVEEEVVAATNAVALGIDNTTSLRINATSHTQYVNWNGVGTEPNLGLAQVGDVVTFGSEFSSSNQGSFMVIRSGAKLQGIDSIVVPSGNQFATSGVGKYFTINNGGNVNSYYVWFNVDGALTNPSPGGLTGVVCAITSSDTSTTVATKLAAAINGGTSGLTATSTAGIVTVTTAGYQETTPAANVNVPAPFAITNIQAGRRTFLECLNASAASQSPVFASSVVCNRPQIKFYEYEATIPGDKIVVAGTILGAGAAGSYVISKVIDRDTVVITGSIATQSNVSMNGLESAFSVQEGTAYYGYKKVHLVSAQPGSTTQNTIVFDSNAQYAKINQASDTELTSINKMNYNTTVYNGLDSYRYNLGLIAEANRIIYGDPRDPETYPGVGALGAEIFVSEPLTRRITIAIVIRSITGAPFTQLSEQVRTSVSSVINSNPIGQSIAISAIVAAVNSVPGVRSVSISSPTYSPTSDIIVLNTAEKARIIDPTTDISVSLYGA